GIQLGDVVEELTPAVTLEGADKVNADTEFTMTLGIQDASNVYAQDMVLSYDKDLFELFEIKGIGNTQVVDSNQVSEGVVRILAMTENGATERQELLALNFKAKDRTETRAGQIAVDQIILGQVDNHQSTTSAAIAINKIVEVKGKPVIIETPDDVNQDGQVDVADLALIAYYYQAKRGDTNWEEAKSADVNQDGKVNI
ncbi:MAG: cohesin domain-containing protein, partial [Niameybacter sp.]